MGVHVTLPSSPAFWRRSLTVGGAVLAAPFLFHQMGAEFEGEAPTLAFIAELLGFGVFGVLLVLAIQSVSPFTSLTWSRPSWNSDPFEWSQPVQIFHLNGWFFIALGISTAIYTVAVGSTTFLFVFPLTIGIGIALGVRLSLFAFRAKFKGE